MLNLSHCILFYCWQVSSHSGLVQPLMGSLLPRQKRLAIVFNLGNALIRKIWKTDLQLLTQRRMQCIRIVSLWKENLEGDAFHWCQWKGHFSIYKIFQFVFLWSVFHLISFDFYVCTLNLSDFDRELLFLFRIDMTLPLLFVLHICYSLTFYIC